MNTNEPEGFRDFEKLLFEQFATMTAANIATQLIGAKVVDRDAEAVAQALLVALCANIARAIISRREFNGYGCYLYFDISKGAAWQQMSPGTFRLGVRCSEPVSGNLMEFVLFVEDGQLAFVEGFPLTADGLPSSMRSVVFES